MNIKKVCQKEAVYNKRVCQYVGGCVQEAVVYNKRVCTYM